MFHVVFRILLLVIYIRDVKSYQIRHPDVRVRYPDTSGCSYRICPIYHFFTGGGGVQMSEEANTIHYVRPYCSIYVIFVKIM